MRNYLILFILILVAVFALWLQEDIKHKPGIDPQTSQRFPDYFMEDFRSTQLDASGLPQYTLKATRMQHYADDDSAELSNPELIFAEGNHQFQLNAGRAVFLQKDNLIHLYDNVKIKRSRADDSPTGTLSIHTEYLKINTLTRIAETDAQATVITPQLTLNSRGLIYNNPEGRLLLTSQVRGTYETQP